jgi:hypothetical protein
MADNLADMFNIPIPQPRPTMFMVGENVPGLVEPGTIDLLSRPTTKNADGSISTVKSMSFNDGNYEVLIPMVAPSGTILTPEGVMALYQFSGKHLGKFKNPRDADAYAEILHRQQEQFYSGARDGR